MKDKCQFTIVYKNSMLSQTLWHTLREKGGESFGFLSGFPHVDFHSSFRTQCFCFSVRNPGKAKKEREKKLHTAESRRGESELGFQWVDWRGFGPLNRSTCSSGISRKQGSILVHWGCLPIMPWVLMAAWVWRRVLVLWFGVVVYENSWSGLGPGHFWCRPTGGCSSLSQHLPLKCHSANAVIQTKCDVDTWQQHASPKTIFDQNLLFWHTLYFITCSHHLGPKIRGQRGNA